jgi:hypothetical protein
LSPTHPMRNNCRIVLVNVLQHFKLPISSHLAILNQHNHSH